MASEVSSRPAFEEHGKGSDKAIYKTERGRQEATAIEDKAKAIIERKKNSLDRRREEWIAREEVKILKKDGLGRDDGPVGPTGSFRNTLRARAEQRFSEQRKRIEVEINDRADKMLEREPGQNRIRDFEPVVRAKEPEKSGEDRVVIDEDAIRKVHPEFQSWWIKSPDQAKAKEVDDGRWSTQDQRGGDQGQKVKQDWWVKSPDETRDAERVDNVERHKMIDVSRERGD